MGFNIDLYQKYIKRDYEANLLFENTNIFPDTSRTDPQTSRYRCLCARATHRSHETTGKCTVVEQEPTSISSFAREMA